MGKWLVRLVVDRRLSPDSGSQNRVTLPQRSLQGGEVVVGVGSGSEIAMPDPIDHFYSQLPVLFLPQT
ncbi:hypothetical protein KUCAC02_024028 [Chaenocephalus aceratus]|uniref:Uncharacterized protein n=1 Tax=Chaenocephalus aceratus TaxID=36190 RepID=A0ACB9WHG8_CHAAC|nr:hypothetical protein KUCAC02_024028 [Chaenocephalus aceratus]